MSNQLYWQYRAAAVISRTLPLPMAYWVGLRIADRYFVHDHAARRAVLANQRRIHAARGMDMTPTAAVGVVRKTFQYFGKYMVDFFRYTRLAPRDVDRMVSIEHREYIDQARARGRGVIFLTAHLGNWELGAAVMAALGYPLNVVFMPERMRKVDELFRNQRRRRGMEPLPLGHAAGRILRTLKDGGMVALLGDRDFTRREDRIPFFGHPARIPRGPAWLACRTGAPIVPGFLLRQVDDTFLLRFHPPLEPGGPGSSEDLRARACRALEKEIGENPHQWFVFEDFWAAGDAPVPGASRPEEP